MLTDDPLCLAQLRAVAEDEGEPGDAAQTNGESAGAAANTREVAWSAAALDAALDVTVKRYGCEQLTGVAMEVFLPFLRFDLWLGMLGEANVDAIFSNFVQAFETQFDGSTQHCAEV